MLGAGMARPSSIHLVRCKEARHVRGEPADALRILIATIIERHHAYLKRELPAIEALLAEVVRVESGIFRATAAALLPVFLRFRRELEAHMKREEITLFPLIERLEAAVAGGRPAPRNSFGPLSNAIPFMNEDHDFENKLLEKMGQMSHQFTSPPGAPAKYASIMDRLRALALDMHEHVRKEDQVLFPEAISLEDCARLND
jgi:regulator of cell morphogenesis and NO signaling